MFWKKLRWRMEYAAFRCLVAFLAVIPVFAQRLLAWSLAFLVCCLLPRRMTRYDLAFQNIRESFGDQYSDAEIDRMIFRMWMHFVRLVAEVVQFPRHVFCENIHDIVEFHRREPVIRALLSDRPVIMLSGHFGNWETSIATFGLFGFPMGVVARTLDNPYLDEWFRRFRESTGHVMIDKRGGGQEMVERLERKQHLALLCDQDAGKRGVFVDFFGRPASTFKSIALLALQHDALICVGTSVRLPDNSHRSGWVRFELSCDAILDPREMTGSDPIHELTQRFTAALEQAVRRSPEQYFWVHRRWKSRPEERTRLRRAG